MGKFSLTFIKTVASIGALAVVSGCAFAPSTSDSAPKPAPDITVLMNDAAAAEKVEPKGGALVKYEAAAKLFPASKLPWLRIAQIQFDATNYGEAIVAAQQVISRDERDKVASSILSVSGLRVATKALGDLSRQNELTGSVKNEAQDLAKVLRENLGEKVLVPVRPVAESPRPQPRPRAPAAAAKSAVTPSAPLAQSPASGGSPFGNLK
jgi:hypothetical protein